jgi:hypothetical protein
MMKTNPCKDCDARHFKCHAECEAYTNWAQEKRKESIETSKVKAALDRMYDYGGKWRRCVYIGRRK